MTQIVVDTSALMAVLLREPDFERYEAVLTETEPLVSAATRVEIAAAARAQRGREAPDRVAELLERMEVSIVAFDEVQAGLALNALARYGRGRGATPAVLNLGDLFSYALAKSRDLPLLYKGDDFTRTDVRSALPASGGAP
jgi:ribonuclease VapC